MERIKFLLSLLCVGTLCLTMISCDNDDDKYYVNSWIGFATVNAPGTTGEFPVGQGGFGLTFDDGTKMWPRMIDTRLAQVRTFDKQRMIVDFTYLNDTKEGYDHTICVNNLRTILTKNIATVNNSTTDAHLLANDKIRIVNAWVGDNYINIVFDYSASPGSTHYINLIDDQRTPVTNPDNGVYSLTFVHDANNDTGTYKARGYVSFPIPENIGQFTKIKIFAKGESTDQEFIIEYKNTSPTDESILKLIDNTNEIL
ncbi:NigD1/NigD2 family lipoprotein [Coprobacter tertius]|uniref:NigD-like protein n=1 Tax=Coprobacter tertius TaxID=2944915 RepID=A0ABT1MIV2_9BACT|nr:NigD-like C-terminal domain-containing protein [Coprobacter tertius]MCP9612553.1 NigD-like protein [Coprobacter tertius]